MGKDRERTLESIFASILKNTDFSLQDLPRGKEFLGTLASWAGKGKDEVVQMICREVGVALAAMLKEPLSQALKGKKIKFTVEFVPDDEKK